MPNNRVNKTIAGYHMLMLLSAVDHKFIAAEDTVIRDYPVQEFPITVDLDKEMEIISSLRADQWEDHYREMMDDFYDDSTESERNNLLQFAIELTKADNVITKEENYYLNLLFDTWKPDEA